MSDVLRNFNLQFCFHFLFIVVKDHLLNLRSACHREVCVDTSDGRFWDAHCVLRESLQSHYSVLSECLNRIEIV